MIRRKACYRALSRLSPRVSASKRVTGIPVCRYEVRILAVINGSLSVPILPNASILVCCYLVVNRSAAVVPSLISISVIVLVSSVSTREVIIVWIVIIIVVRSILIAVLLEIYSTVTACLSLNIRLRLWLVRVFYLPYVFRTANLLL